MPVGHRAGEVGVEEVRPYGLIAAHVLEDRAGLRVELLHLLDQGVVEHALPHSGARLGDQQLGVGVANQWIRPVGFDGPRGSDHHGRGADAGGDVPGVVVRA